MLPCLALVQFAGGLVMLLCLALVQCMAPAVKFLQVPQFGGGLVMLPCLALVQCTARWLTKAHAGANLRDSLNLGSLRFSYAACYALL
jgi:hypothetical protein